MTRKTAFVALLAAGTALPAPALAQYAWDDASVTGGEEPTQSSQYPDEYGDEYGDEPGDEYGGRARPRGAPVRQRLRVDPYVEASQVYTRELQPGDDESAFAQVGAGVDASVQGRRGGGSISLRYDRVISYGDDIDDSDNISGIGRGYVAAAPGITLEAGGLAARTRVQNGGAATIASGQVLDADNESQIYSVYAGPNVSTRAGPAEISANYRFGYNRIEEPGAGVVDNSIVSTQTTQESIVHSANARVGIAPQTVLPVGVGVGGGAYQEEVSNLDQRVRDVYARGDVAVPLGRGLSLVGGVGYEYVQVSNRDVVRDGVGQPVLDADGRLQTDDTAPRQIAFETEGLIWDVGVVWKPSRRTQFEAHYGRRYDSDTYYGSFSWQASSRTTIGASVYDSVSGFGGTITNSLANLPTAFAASRNAFTGDFTGCVTGTSADGSSSCIGGSLASVRGAIFRNRGVAYNFSTREGRITTGITLGYDRRSFFGAAGTELASANGLVDQSFYGNVSLGASLDPFSAITVNGYASYVDQASGTLGDALLLGTSAAYSRTLFRNLTARAAISLDTIESELLDETNASALVGLRYDF